MSEIPDPSEAGSTEPAMPSQPYTGQLFAHLAIAALALTALLDVLQIAISFMARASLRNDVNVYGEWVPPEWLFAFDSILIFGPILALVATATAFLTWLSRAYAYAGQRGELAKYPILGWFIPFANLWLPYHCMRDVWTTITRKSPGLVQIWWGFWVARAFVSAATRTEPTTLDQLANFHVAMIAAAFVDLIAAILAARVVLQIDAAARSDLPTTF